MTDRTALAAHRYRLLLRQFRAEWDAANKTERGFFPWAAERLGISSQYVGMIWRDVRSGAAPVDEAMATSHIKSAFFYEGSMQDEPDYKNFVEKVTRLEREDTIEMRTVTEYFTRYPDQANVRTKKHPDRTVRERVNATLNASNGNAPIAVVRAVAVAMLAEDDE